MNLLCETSRLGGIRFLLRYFHFPRYLIPPCHSLVKGGIPYVKKFI
jgi:hypothetical protein